MNCLIISHTGFITSFFSNSVFILTWWSEALWFKGYRTIRFILSSIHYVTLISQLKFKLTIFQLFTSQDLVCLNSCSGWSWLLRIWSWRWSWCSVFIHKCWFITSNCRYQLTLAIVCNLYGYCVDCRIVSNILFIASFFSNSVGMCTCFCICDWWEYNFSICSICCRADDFVAFLQFKFIFTCF